MISIKGMQMKMYAHHLNTNQDRAKTDLSNRGFANTDAAVIELPR